MIEQVTLDAISSPQVSNVTPQRPSSNATGSKSLLSKNIRIHKHRTSVRLEPAMWEARSTK